MAKIVDREAMRNFILDAAATTFVEKGYHSATISDLARAAGLGKGTLYLYFKSKEAIAEALIDRHFREMADRLHAESRPQSLAAFLDGICRAMETPGDKPGVVRVFFEVYGPSFATEEFIRTLSARFDELGGHYAAALDHLLALGELRPDLDTRLTGRALASLVDGMVLHDALFSTSSEMGRALRSQAVNLFLRGLAPGPR